MAHMGGDAFDLFNTAGRAIDVSSTKYVCLEGLA